MHDFPIEQQIQHALLVNIGTMTTLFGRILLGASALTFLAYGGISLSSPAIPAGIAGIEILSGDGFAEVSGMYGGLQTGIGLFCLLAFFKHDYYRSGLIILGLTMISLAIARSSGILMTPAPVTLYSYGALAFEFVVAALAFFALSRMPNDPA